MSSNNILRPKLPPGRPKGCKNRMPVNIRQKIEDAFEKVGGEKYLIELAKKDPKTFAVLLGKILPNQVSLGSETGLPAISISFTQSNTSKLDNDTLNNIKEVNEKDETVL